MPRSTTCRAPAHIFEAVADDAPRTVLRPQVATRQDVLEDGHALEQGVLLKDAGYPEARPVVRRVAGDVVALEGDGATRGLERAVDEVEYVLLPAPMGPMRSRISPHLDVTSRR